jgi:hypothetical protein
MRTRLLFLTLLASLAAIPASAAPQFLHTQALPVTSGVQAATGAAPLNIPGVFSGNAFLNTAANVAAELSLNGLPTMNAVASCTGDFNADGIADILVVANDPDPSRPGSPIVATITVVLGNGDGTFSAPHVYAADNTQNFGVTCGDINGDGVTDVAVLASAPDPANPGSQLAGVLVFTGQSLMNTPLGANLPPQADFDLTSTLVGPNGQPISLQFAKLDGDGLPDLLVATTDANDGLFVSTFLSNGSPLNDSSPFVPAGVTAQIQRDPNGAVHPLGTMAVGSSNLPGAPLSQGRSDYSDVFLATNRGIVVLANDTQGALSETNPGGGLIPLTGPNWGVAFDSGHNFQIDAMGANGGIGELTTVTPTDSTLGSGYQTPVILPVGAGIPDDFDSNRSNMDFVMSFANSGAQNGSVVTLKQQAGSWGVDTTLALPSYPTLTPTGVGSAIYNVFDAALNDVETVEASDATTGNPGGVTIFFPLSSSGYGTIAKPSGATTTTSVVLSPASVTSCQALAVNVTVATAASGTPTGVWALIIDGQRTRSGTISGTTVLTNPALPKGTHEFTVVFHGVTSWAGSNASQTVTVAPCAATVDGIDPASGPVGTTVTVLGTGFLAFAAKAACVGTQCANATVLDDSHLTFPVMPTMQTGSVALSSAAQGF